MKKILLIFTLFSCYNSTCTTRSKIKYCKRFDLKNHRYFLRIYLSGDTSIGISGLYNFEQKSADFRYNEESMVTPYLRHYFTSDRVWNLFGEGFLRNRNRV